MIPNSFWTAAPGRAMLLLALSAWGAPAAPAQEPPAALRPYKTEFTAEEQARLDESEGQTREAVKLFNGQRYAEALPLALSAVETRKEVLGEEHPAYAIVIDNLASIYRGLGKYDEAETLFRQALEINRATIGERTYYYELCLRHVAGTLEDRGQFTDALPLYSKFNELTAQVDGERSAEHVQSLIDLGRANSETGEVEAADALYQEALSIKKDLAGENDPAYADTLHNVAYLYVIAGNYPRAEQLYSEALAIRRDKLGVDSEDYAITVGMLGQVYLSVGQYNRAEMLFREALERKKKLLGEHHLFYGVSLSDLAMLYHTTGDNARAEPLARQALDIEREVHGEEHADYADSLDQLASIYEGMGQVDKSVPLFRQALDIRRRVLGEKHPAYLRSLSKSANRFAVMEEYDTAERYFRYVLNLEVQIYGPKHPALGSTLQGLGLVYQWRGDLRAAQSVFVQAANNVEGASGAQHQNYAVCIGNLAEVEEALGDFDAARRLFAQSLAICTNLADARASFQDEAGQLRLMQDNRRRLDSYVSFLLRRDDGAADAYQAVLNWKGATLVRQRAERLAAKNPELKAKFDQLQSVVRVWSALVTGKGANDPAWTKKLDEVTERKRALEAELSSSSADFRAAMGEVTWKSLQEALPADAALVDYLEFVYNAPDPKAQWGATQRKSIVGFVVRPGREVRMVDLGESAPIHEAIERWRAGYGATKEAAEAGRLLREKLWTPLADSIGDAQLVIVSPDGALGKLPFAALPGKAPGTYLIEDVAVALAPVPRLIPALMLEPEEKDMPIEALVVGDVDYDQRAAPDGRPPIMPDLRPGYLGPLPAAAAAPAKAMPAQAPSRSAVDIGDERAVSDGASWAHLDYTASEATEITKLFGTLLKESGREGRVTHLDGVFATEEAFREAAPQARVLHLATHGFFAAEDKKSALGAEGSSRSQRSNPFGEGLAAIRGYSPGLLSGIVMAGVNGHSLVPDKLSDVETARDDGIVTAEEIAALPMTGTRLVVMSACETGLGEVAGGEGLIGIQRAFQIAGVRTTIATLWQVDDARTEQLMTAFYRNVLKKKQSYLDALRNAQREMLNELRAKQLAAGGAARGANAPEGEAPAATGSPYYWAAFTLSGDWR
jgi:CHAT domain-containing protein/Tfp pilus assembly protein PilF